MRWNFLFCLVAFLLIPNKTFSQPDIKLHEKCLYPTIMVFSDRNNGSGVIIRSYKISEDKYYNFFLTCSHVVDKNHSYKAKVFKYKSWSIVEKTLIFPVNFYSVDEDRDMAIGSFTSTEEMPVASLSFESEMYIANQVWRIGCGFGDDPRVDFGKLTSLNKSYIRTSIHTVPGDSGGPLFHDYKIIGLMRAIKTYREIPVFGISFAVPISHFRIWSLEQNNAFDFLWDAKDYPKLPLLELDLQNNYDISIISK